MTEDLACVDVELRGFLEKVPPLKLDEERLARSRGFVEKAAGVQESPYEDSLDITEIHVHRTGGEGAVRVVSYRPKLATANLPVVLHAHGGGYVMGLPEMAHADNCEMAHVLQCAVYSVDYRLAPEHPYPAAIQDMYSVLLWLHAEADKLGVVRERIGIKGESAGGGLAAAVALYSRDHGGPRLAFQHLFYPMLDDRTCVREDLSPHLGRHMWRPEHNVFAWSALLGHAPGKEEVSCYAAAARAIDLSGLPPTYIATGALDLFVEESMDYAKRLLTAGVPTEFHIYPGAYHGFRSVTSAQIAQRAHRDSTAYLQRHL